ncbi:hypothetical protein [Streptomyces sp. NPDC098781]
MLHTDPQLVIPYDGLVHVDGRARRIAVMYGPSSSAPVRPRN